VRRPRPACCRTTLGRCGPVVAGQQRQAQGAGVHPCCRRPGHEDQVAARLAHLLAVEPDHPGVHVGAGEGSRSHRPRRAPLTSRGAGRAGPIRRPGRRAGCRAGAARWRCTRRATRAARVRAGTPRTAPRPGRQPQQRVERVLLAVPLRITTRARPTGQHGVRVVPGDLPESARRGDREVDVVLDAVGRAAVEQLLHEGGDLLHRLDGADVVRRRQDAQRGHVLAEQGGLTLRDRHPVLAVAGGALEQRVVDVGDVLHVVDVQPAVAPQAHERVEGEVGGGVAQVRRVVRRDAADVQPRRRPLRRPPRAARRWSCRAAGAARRRSPPAGRGAPSRARTA
jgi:hypothetical protein